MFENDYIMRQISLAVQFVARLVFGNREPVYVEENSRNPTGGDLLHREIMRLLHENRVNDAENALFDQLDSGIPNLPEIATDFYCRLSRMSDKQLEESGFSREEIDQGLLDFMRRCGVAIPEFK